MSTKHLVSKKKVTAKKAQPITLARATGSRATAKKKMTLGGRGPSDRITRGYTKDKGTNLYLREDPKRVVKGSKLKQGLQSAREEIEEILDGFVAAMTQKFEVRELKLSASFSADGRFLGFGVGGEAVIEITLVPVHD